MDTRSLVSEFTGTLLLVLFAVGSSVLASAYIGTLGIALAFGFTLLVLCYAFGPVSGCHLNPAVTLGMLLARRIGPRAAGAYCVAQLLGGIAGAALLYLVAKQIPGLQTSGSFGSNGFADRSPVRISTGGAFIAEVLLTFLLVFVYLAVTRGMAIRGVDGVPAGLALAVVSLVGGPLTGASVNPARSLGPALFAGGQALSQVWLFVLAPLVGAALAAGVHQATHAGPQRPSPAPAR